MDFSIILPILLGWAGGLFINYIADVLPYTRKLTQPTCPNCQTQFSWLDYLTLRACRSCGKRRSLRTWLVQILTTASFAYFWLFPSKLVGTPLGLIILIYFGIVTVIDLEHRLILHPTSIAGAALGLIAGTLIHSQESGLLIGTGKSLLGGLFGFGVMFIIHYIARYFTRRRARKLQETGQEDDGEDALGDADVILLGVLGLMFGWPLILDVLLLGIVLGGLFGFLFVVAHLLRRRSAGEAMMTPIPYGPYFIASAFYFLFLFL